MIQSDLLSTISGLRHGFTTKDDSLELLKKLDSQVTTAKQVHKEKLIWPQIYEKKTTEADALATFSKKFAIGVYSADCAPILLVVCDVDLLPFGILTIHAGWRGTALQIAAKSLHSFHKQLILNKGMQPEDLRYFAAIGPCISFESFEVGQEVIDAFPQAEKQGMAKFLRLEGEKKKYLFNLAGENKRQLEDISQTLGLNIEADIMPYCTVKSASTLPSFRREREKAGRILSFLSLEE